METYLQFLISYKKELIYLAFFVLGFFICKVNYLDCTRETICSDDISSKKKAFEMLSDLKKKHLDESRKKEDLHKSQCKSKITKALKEKKTAANSLDCYICKNLMLQCK